MLLPPFTLYTLWDKAGHPSVHLLAVQCSVCLDKSVHWREANDHLKCLPATPAVYPLHTQGPSWTAVQVIFFPTLHLCRNTHATGEKTPNGHKFHNTYSIAAKLGRHHRLTDTHVAAKFGSCTLKRRKVIKVRSNYIPFVTPQRQPKKTENAINSTILTRSPPNLADTSD